LSVSGSCQIRRFITKLSLYPPGISALGEQVVCPEKRIDKMTGSIRTYQRAPYEYNRCEFVMAYELASNTKMYNF
jgi:hypothetical protein